MPVTLWSSQSETKELTFQNPHGCRKKAEIDRSATRRFGTAAVIINPEKTLSISESSSAQAKVPSAFFFPNPRRPGKKSLKQTDCALVISTEIHRSESWMSSEYAKNRFRELSHNGDTCRTRCNNGMICVCTFDRPALF